ncbi:DNA repair protein RecN [Chlorobium phaeovibrioides]|uniref:DNA repair protein RecN n=2 Tax=Chlorobium phaeovibrioides TaxID=1094 RepID=A0A5M8IFG2_CHLPH|nr:DNA repair protein RecN [Chlorobium phaeovibrioides]KAA6233029.1 DNA repair protein RecN [Chlorobium phaeovibrioides]MWV53605.1 DNA repair protein RecN [Chlorobium phaeovibrioides]HCD36089.1 DNA repair protein RecN [Chlorobium sp.]
MLSSLYIRNFALIEELTIAFQPGLTVITGETGAGKSIIIGALGLVLGDRSSSEMVRTDATKAVIEAIFRNNIPFSTQKLLQSAEIDPGAELIIRRELSATGQSRCFINDTPCTLTLLKQVGELLIDLHGQHEHQLLLQSRTHETLLDAFAGTASDAETCRAQKEEIRLIQKKLNTLRNNAEALAEKRDLLDFQYRELSETGMQEGEYEELQQQISLLENAETLAELCSSLNSLLYDADNAIYPSLGSASKLTEKLAAIDPRFNEMIEQARIATDSVDELYRFSRSYSAGIDHNPVLLDSLRERHHLIGRIAKKYAVPPDEIPRLALELERQLNADEGGEDSLQRTEASLTTLRRKLSQTAFELSQKRKEAAKRLEISVKEQLSLLGIPRALFIVSFTHTPDPEGDITIEGVTYGTQGCGYDSIEFLISANPGEKPRPLVKVASGGEISRVMLAMKSALATNADLPILIFDEIDTGISGRIADAVGRNIKSLSSLHQIVAITHLPQIAAMGDSHLRVHKEVENSRTLTKVSRIEGTERLEAIAALISGEHRSASSLSLAGELVEAAATIKPPSV